MQRRVEPSRFGRAIELSQLLRLAALACLLGCAVAVSGCNVLKQKVAKAEKAEISDQTQFSVAETGVPASPRVTELKKVAKGGGRYSVGKPYRVRGKWYKPRENPTYAATGIASWYGPNFHGRLTANGEIYDQYALSAAHPTLPLPSYVRVTNLENGRSVMVRVNDRGPYAHKRLIDLSARTAKLLDFAHKGVAKVRVEYAGKARLDGKDEKFLMASYRGPGAPEIAPGASQPGTLIAMADDLEPAGSVGAAQTFIAGSVADPGEILEIAFVPIPLQRPATYDGIPLGLGEDAPFAIATLVPLGFAAESIAADKITEAFAPFEAASALRLAPSGIDERVKQTAIVRLGVFRQAGSAEYVRATFAGLGLVSVKLLETRSGQEWEVSLIAGEDAADQVIEIAKRRGLTGAGRISD